MSRSFLIALSVCMVFIFQGCGALEYVDGSSKDEIEKFKMSKDEMWNELKKARKENIQLQNQVSALEKENQRTKDEYGNRIKELRDQHEFLNGQLIELKEENIMLTDENRALLQKAAALQADYETPLSESYELEKCLRGLKIKVLSGDGDLSSAREMSKRLREKGCKIESIHYASRSDFSHTIVYSKSECKNKAKRLVSCLGNDTIYKALTWSSEYDIIVVTGKHP